VKLTEQKIKNLIREAATEYIWGVKGLHSRLGNQYKLHTIGKGALNQVIKEELEVVLTNEEAGELFGEELEELLNEKDLEEKKKYKPSFYKAKEKRAEHLKSKGVDDDLAFAIADKQMSKAGKKKKK